MNFSALVLLMRFMAIFWATTRCKNFGKLGCAWNTFLEGQRPQVLREPLRWLWMMRWFEFCRIIRLGYNVLMLDADVGFSQNVYKFLKSVPFIDANFIGSQEGYNWWGFNGGTSYAQNVAPNGATAWMAAEVAYRTLRWLESSEFVINKFPDSKDVLYDITFEQHVLNDALCSLMLEESVFPVAWHQQMSENIQSWELYNQLCMGWQKVKVRWPQDWYPTTWLREDDLQMMEFKVPCMTTDFEKHGGQPWPTEFGRLSFQLMELLHSQKLPMWELPERRKRELCHMDWYTETFVYAPRWLFGQWQEMRQGLFGGQQSNSSQTVVTHMIGIGGTEGRGKRLALQTYGLWHQQIDSILNNKRSHQQIQENGNTVLNYSSNQQLSLPSYEAGKFLKYSFKEQLSLPSYEEVVNVFEALAMLGSLTQRNIVWPTINCSQNWIHKVVKEGPFKELDAHPNATHDIYDQSVLPYYDNNGQLSCQLLPFATQNCEQIGALFDVEYKTVIQQRNTTVKLVSCSEKNLQADQEKNFQADLKCNWTIPRLINILNEYTDFDVIELDSVFKFSAIDLHEGGQLLYQQIKCQQNR